MLETFDNYSVSPIYYLPGNKLGAANQLVIDPEDDDTYYVSTYWDGVYKITYKPAKKLPVEEFLRPQRRFKHMFKPGNEWMIEEFQKEVDKRWEELLNLEKLTNQD